MRAFLKRTRPLAGGRRFGKADFVREAYCIAAGLANFALPVVADFAIALLIVSLIALAAWVTS